MLTCAVSDRRSVYSVLLQNPMYQISVQIFKYRECTFCLGKRAGVRGVCAGARASARVCVFVRG